MIKPKNKNRCEYSLCDNIATVAISMEDVVLARYCEVHYKHLMLSFIPNKKGKYHGRI